MTIKHFLKEIESISLYTGTQLIKDHLKRGKAFLVVNEDESYLGILHIKDIKKKECVIVGDCVTEKPFLNIDTLLNDALQMMIKTDNDVLPVEKNKKYVGVVFKDDLVNYLKEQNKEMQQELLKKTQELQELNQNLKKLVEDCTKELMENNSTKDKFLSIIAHDLRTPFNGIMGFSQLIIEVLKRGNVEKAITFAEEIYQNSVQTLNLLDNLITWANLQKSKISTDFSEVNLFEIVENVLRTQKLFAETKHIIVVNQIKENTTIVADEYMLHTVLRNVISNAIKFTKTYGVIAIYSQKKNNHIMVCVQDNGEGIPEEKINVILQDNDLITDKEKHKTNSGLGLRLCKEFMKMHNGKIEIESKINEGTVVKLCFPLNLSVAKDNLKTQSNS